MTLTERIQRIEAERHLPDNVVPFERRERRQVPRWIEWTRENEQRGKALDMWGGDAA
jgi:hypothetical protein